jgi:hypothetical protein
MSGKRIDANQPSIVKTLRNVGAGWIPLSGDPTTGMDGLILFRSKVYLAEIKDGAKKPSERQLTDKEKKRKAMVEAHGVDYNIIESEEDALRLIGILN